MSGRTLIVNGLIVTATDAYQADILIEQERIALIGTDLADTVEADHVVDASGKYVLPGGIDVHTHLELYSWDTVSADDFYTGHVAAAFGGTTCHIDFANQVKGESLQQALEAWHARAEGKAVIDYGFHVSITDPRDDVLAEMARLPEWGVTSVKLFLAYKGVYQLSDGDFFRVCRRAAELGLLPIVHAENGDVIDILVREALAQGHTPPVWHARTRPPEAEAEATQRAIWLAEMAGSPVYIVHLTQRDALAAVSAARARGRPVYAETCVQYLFFTVEDLERPNFEGAKWVCSPPFRTDADREALWRGLARGDLSVVATDHCPFNFATQKVLGRDRFDKIPNGVPAIEDRLIMLYHAGVHEGRLSLHRFVEVTSTNPAKLFGLYPRKGTVAVGSDADLVIWDPGARHVRRAETHHMNVDYNLWEGWEVVGRPEKVFSRGRLIVDGERFLGTPGSGRYVHRRAPLLSP